MHSGRITGNTEVIPRAGKPYLSIYEIGSRSASKKSPAFVGEYDDRAFVLRCDTADDYFTTDWKSGEVRRLANWLSVEE
jgi:hypothetical protein